jgi:uncharacterized protein (DUF1778 family)
MTKTARTPKRASLAKQHRIAARVTDEQHALFQRAAAMQGRTLTDFVVSTLQEKALQTIETLEIIRLNAAESRKLAEALLSPPREPTERQLAIKKLYSETITHN